MKYCFLLLLSFSSMIFAAEDYLPQIELTPEDLNKMCSVCFEEDEPCDPNIQNCDVCRTCFLGHVAFWIDQGEIQIPNVKKIESEEDFRYYDQDFIISYLQTLEENALLEKYKRNIVRWTMDGLAGRFIPCSHKDCPGKFEKKKGDYLPVGEICKVCDQKYELADLEESMMQKYRMCPHCGKLFVRDSGCDHMRCTRCGKNFHYPNAKRPPQYYIYMAKIKEDNRRAALEKKEAKRLRKKAEKRRKEDKDNCLIQ